MPLTWKSPVCDFSKIPSGYSIEFSIPSNEYTRAIFGNPERFTKYRIENDQKFPGLEVRFSGMLLMSGNLQINGFTPDGSGSNGSYSASIIDMVGVLGDKEQERDILEIPVFADEIDWDDTDNFNPDEHQFCCFPIHNDGFFKDKGMKVTRELPSPADGSSPGTYDVEILTFLFVRTFGTVNERSFTGSDFIERNSADIILNNYTQSTGAVTVVTPFFFLNNIIKLALKDNGFHLLENIFTTNTSLKNICIYNNFDATITEFVKEGIWKTIPWEPTITYTVSGGYIVEDEWKRVDVGTGKKILDYLRSYDDKIVPKNHMPKMKVGEMLLSTQNLFNLVFHFLPNSTINVFSREAILTGASIDLDSYFLGKWQIDERKNVALKFVREHDDKDLIFSERYHDLSDRRADIKTPVNTIESLQLIPTPAEGEIRYVYTLNAFYEYRMFTEEELDPVTKGSNHIDVFGWKEISIGLQDGWYEYGRDEVEEIKSGWSSCAERDNYVQVDQSGAMNVMKDKNQSFSPRLLIRDDLSNNAGSTHTAVFSFEYETPVTGIFAKFWKNWNPFWANRLPVTGSFDLPKNVLYHAIHNICKKFRTREGEFLIEEMSCTIYIDHISEVTIKGYKV